MNSKWTPGHVAVESDGSEIYLTANNGLTRLCTMARAGETVRRNDAKEMAIRVNAFPEFTEALRSLYKLAARVGEPEHKAMQTARTLLAKLEDKA